MSNLSEETLEKIQADTMGQENERALDEAYEDGLQAGREEMELEMLDQIDEARKEGYDEGYAEALENAIKAMEGLQ
jgi:hypothetical protein